MTTAPLYDQLGEALKAQRQRFGDTAFDNRRRMIALLADTLPDARREIRAVASALDEGAIEALTSVERRLLGMEMDRQADRLEQSVGLRADLARQVIRALAYALDLGPPPSVYEAAPSIPPAGGAAGGASDWAGLTETPGAPPVSPPPSQSWPSSSPPPYPAAAHTPSARPRDVLFTFQGRAFTRTHAAIVLVIAAAVSFGPSLISGLTGGRPETAPMQEQNQNPAPGQAQGSGYAEELTDQGVRPQETLESNVGSPTPMTVPGGQRITTQELQALAASSPDLLLIDVLADPHAETLRGAHYLPAAGQPGAFNDAAQTLSTQVLQGLTGGRKDRPLVMFCAGSACWESYNAVLRARAAGYTRLYWYRGGLAAWRTAGLPMQPLPAPAQASAPRGR